LPSEQKRQTVTLPLPALLVEASGEELVGYLATDHLPDADTLHQMLEVFAFVWRSADTWDYDLTIVRTCGRWVYRPYLRNRTYGNIRQSSIPRMADYVVAAMRVLPSATHRYATIVNGPR
jgi:hypothetical protein